MNVEQLVQAIQTLNVYDAFRPRFSAENWRVVGAYLIRREIRSGGALIRQGESDRTMYILEAGALQVYRRGDATPSAKIALLRAGAIVGEPALFGDAVRMAQVDAISVSIAWALTRPRLDEMLAGHPELAYEILRASGAVMAERMRGMRLRGTLFA